MTKERTFFRKALRALHGECRWHGGYGLSVPQAKDGETKSYRNESCDILM